MYKFVYVYVKVYVCMRLSLFSKPVIGKICLGKEMHDDFLIRIMKRSSKLHMILYIDL